MQGRTARVVFSAIPYFWQNYVDIFPNDDDAQYPYLKLAGFRPLIPPTSLTVKITDFLYFSIVRTNSPPLMRG